MDKQWIFIYSAKGNLIADIAGAARKLIKGASLCSLCNITYGVATQKDEWRDFLENLTVPTKFLHSDEIPSDITEFIKKENVELPAVLENSQNEYKIIADSDFLAKCEGDPKCLINHLTPL
jgi:hypothetical protein